MHSTSEVVLEARGLHRSMGDQPVVQDVSISLNRGDVLGLLGLNGAGKSTTLRLLSGVLAPDAGEIDITGYSLADQPMQARARLGFLPDQPPLYLQQRVEHYLALCARLRRVPRAMVHASVESTLQRCDLLDVRRNRIGQLSKGYRQRVGLAQALVHRPDVVLLDEPSNGLDPQQMQGMRSLIHQLAEHCGVIFSTHLLNEAEAVCNRIAVMHAGQLIHDQPTQTGSDSLESLFTSLLHGYPQVGAAST